MTSSHQEVHVRGRGTPGRCGYCHDEVTLEERTACAACLAVHHAECWSGERKCAACGNTAVLAPAKDAATAQSESVSGAAEGMFRHAFPQASKAIDASPVLRAIRGLAVLSLIGALITRGEGHWMLGDWIVTTSALLLALAGVLGLVALVGGCVAGVRRQPPGPTNKEPT